MSVGEFGVFIYVDFLQTEVRRTDLKTKSESRESTKTRGSYTMQLMSPESITIVSLNLY